MVRLVRTLFRNSDVRGLFWSEFSQNSAELLEMQSSDFFVQFLGKSVDSQLVVLSPQRDLSQALVGEAVGHDKAGVSSGASQVHESSVSEHNDAVVVREGPSVYLRLDVGSLDAWEVLET